MHIVLWDTRRGDVTKDFAGGFGVGQFPRGAAWPARSFAMHSPATAGRWHWPMPIWRQFFANWATRAICRRPRARGADVYIFHPSLVTLPLETPGDARGAGEAIPAVGVRHRAGRAYALPRRSTAWTSRSFGASARSCCGSSTTCLADYAAGDRHGQRRRSRPLPLPDWSLFGPRRFRVSLRLLAISHGPDSSEPGLHAHVQLLPVHRRRERGTRFRTPESVVDEMRHGMQTSRLPLVQIPRSAVRARSHAHAASWPS